jgi:hypothetical protein
MKWEILQELKKNQKLEDIIDLLLANRGIKTAKDKTLFLNPKFPDEITLQDIYKIWVLSRRKSIN